MERIAEIIGTVCISVLVVTILYSISSFPSTEKVIKFVISIYIIINTVTVITDNKVDFDFYFIAIGCIFCRSRDCFGVGQSDSPDQSGGGWR